MTSQGRFEISDRYVNEVYIPAYVPSLISEVVPVEHAANGGPELIEVVHDRSCAIIKAGFDDENTRIRIFREAISDLKGRLSLV